jgi:uncharacterized protein YegL
MPSATLPSRPVFLPVLVAQLVCSPQRKNVDVALVLDTSNSMTGQKLDAARAAALEFADLMDLRPGADQLTIARFDNDAQVILPLSTDRRQTQLALASLATDEGTYIDQGMLLALRELSGPRHLPLNAAVMVVLTDGRQTGGPEMALAAARSVRNAAVALYMIGLGADVDAPTMVAMAEQPAHYRFAPTSGDLAAIYADVARVIRCRPAVLWPGGSAAQEGVALP